MNELKIFAGKNCESRLDFSGAIGYNGTASEYGQVSKRS